jgi:DNA-binding winged helix-turn-helix (wHTH) protein/TolB-like protein/Tfp pilus assembly protein PilF
MEHRIESIFVFGNYRLDPEGQVLLRNNEIVPLTPKLFETLRLLVENGGRTLSKETFLTSLWPDTFVEESNLAQNIFHLRRVLGEDSRGKIFIKTVPKRGYRFVAPTKLIPTGTLNGHNKISILENGQTAHGSEGNGGFQYRWPLVICVVALFVFGPAAFWTVHWRLNQVGQIASVSSIDGKSLAVLKFKQIGGGDDQLSMGMTDALITKLSTLKQLKIRPTSSIFQSKQVDPVEIGRELRVGKILDGSIQQTRDSVRVSVQLINVENGVTIWAKSFDASSTNIFEVQDAISEQVSHSLLEQLSESDSLLVSKRYTGNLEAYEAYSRGRYFWAISSRSDLGKAVEHFQRAISLDPQYSLAYSGLADAQILIASSLSGTPRAKTNQNLAKINAVKALELDNSLAEPHATLAAVIFEEKGDWAAAEAEFLKSIELNPNYAAAHNWYALHLLAQGQFERAEVELKKALEIDPVSPGMNLALGQIYYFAKQYDRSTEQFGKTLELDPEFLRAKLFMGLSLEAAGRTDDARPIFEQLNRDFPKYTAASTALGCLYADEGNHEGARDLLKALDRVSPPSIFETYGIAVINAHLGNTEKSLLLLSDISRTKNVSIMARIKFDPKLDILRQDSRFQKFLLD